MSRRALFNLWRAKSSIENVISLLSSKRKNLNWSEFENLVFAIHICCALQESDQFMKYEHMIQNVKGRRLDGVMRESLVSAFSTILEDFNPQITFMKPETDSEVFLSMCDTSNVSRWAWTKMMEEGVFMLMLRRGKFVLSGTKPPCEFFRRMSEVFGFVQPDAYFVYSQEARPIAAEDIGVFSHS